MQKKQNASEGCVGVHEINKQVSQQVGPRVGGDQGQQHQSVGSAPAVCRGLESDLRVILMASFGSGPTHSQGTVDFDDRLYWGWGGSNQSIFTKMKGEELACGEWGGICPFPPAFPVCAYIPSMFDECSVRNLSPVYTIYL